MSSFTLNHDVLVRQWQPGDADAIYAAVSQNYEHLREFMHWAKPDYSIDDARQFLEASVASAVEGRSLGFGIFRGADVIGSIGFVKFDHKVRCTEIGYWIAGSEQGRGIITQACRALVEHAFEVMNMNRIEIRCAVENVRSSAVAERLGFTKEGTLRQSEIRNGRLLDFNIYGLLAKDWQNTREAIENHP